MEHTLGAVVNELVIRIVLGMEGSQAEASGQRGQCSKEPKSRGGRVSWHMRMAAV